MSSYPVGEGVDLLDDVDWRRVARVAAVSVGIAGIVIGVQFQSVVTGYGLLIAALFGGALGVKSRYRDGYVFYGNLILGTIFGPLLAWVFAGVFPTLYIDVGVFTAMVSVSVRTGAKIYPVLMSFYAGLFAGILGRGLYNRASTRAGVGLVLVGLLGYTVAHLALAGLRPTLGEAGIRMLGQQGGQARLFEVAKLFSGIVGFAGVAAVSEEVGFDRLLLAAAVVCAAFAGAGVASTHAEFQSILTAEAVSGALETEVGEVGMDGEAIEFAVTVRNPTDTEVVVTAGFMQVFDGNDQIAFGPIQIQNEGGTVVVPPGETATVQVSMPLSPDQTEAVSAAMAEDGIRLDGRLSVEIAGSSANVPVEASTS